MRWACFALLVLALLGGFAYEYARRERSWDGAIEAEEEERGLAEGAGDGWLDPWPRLWRHGTEGAAGPGFQRRWLRRRRRLRTMTMEQGTHSADEAKAVDPVAGSRRRAIAINATAATTSSSKPWRDLQLLDAAALRPFQAPVNFTTAGLRRAPPYTGLSNCFYTYVGLGVRQNKFKYITQSNNPPNSFLTTYNKQPAVLQRDDPGVWNCAALQAWAHLRGVHRNARPEELYLCAHHREPGRAGRADVALQRGHPERLKLIEGVRRQRERWQRALYKGRTCEF